jgi:site-specific recombinase XerD
MQDSDITKALRNYRKNCTNAQSTKANRIIVFKRFLKWLVKSKNNTKIEIDTIDEIKEKITVEQKTEKDILTGDELDALFKHVKNNQKNLTFLQILYDTGARVNEICKLQWSQVIFDSENKTVKIRVKSKTDKERKIPLLTYGASLKLWYNNYDKIWKDGENQGVSEDAYVFYSHTGGMFEPLPYNTAYRIVKDTAKKAGIEKKVHPHLFRHTRITDLLRQGYSETEIKK